MTLLQLFLNIFKIFISSCHILQVPVGQNFDTLPHLRVFLLVLKYSYPYSEFSGPYFLVFGLNTERYGLSLCVQSECRKIQTRKTTNTDTFRGVFFITFVAHEHFFNENLNEHSPVKNKIMKICI